MIQLPRPLEPWRPWLTLFDAELAHALGQLLMQLHPLVGKLRAGAPSPDDTPVGVGNIVRRGSYERMLISEWAYADAAPDEFIRRAASGELLFNGPEPERKRSSRLSIVLFDVGPMQLGEPRLAHLALLILLARRAQEDNAEFRWGVVQHPGTLHAMEGRDSVRELLARRTLDVASEAHRNQWDAYFDRQDDVGDCWHVGGRMPQVPRAVTAQVTIVPTVMGDKLLLSLTQRQASRAIELQLPSPDVGVSLLRRPFDKKASAPTQLKHARKPSLQQKPLFGYGGHWLAIAALDGGAALYHVPRSANEPAGKPRGVNAPGNGYVLGANVFRKSYAQVLSVGEDLIFSGFPGKCFDQSVTCPRPHPQLFRAPPGLGRWLPTFYFAEKWSNSCQERVVMLGSQQQLVCWTRDRGSRAAPKFESMGDHVIGAEQFGAALIYVRSFADSVDIYQWTSKSTDRIRSFPFEATRALVSGRGWEGDGKKGLLALQTSGAKWAIIQGDTSLLISVPDGCTVVGVALSSPESGGHPGLVTLDKNRKSISLRTQGGSALLFQSELALAQVTLDAAGQRICWIAHGTHELVVRPLLGGAPLLRIVANGENDAA